MAGILGDEAAPPVSPVVQLCRPVLAVVLTLGSLAWAGDVFRRVGLYLFTEQFLAAMIGLALALVYLHFPARRKTQRGPLPWYDALASLAGLIAGGYVAAVYPQVSDRLIEAPPDALAVSVVLLLLCLEGLRRTVGYSLLAIVLFFIVYALVGHLVPGDLETHKVQLDQFLTYLALDPSALLGLPIYVGTTIVIPFVLFGQLLLHSGGSSFFNDLSLTLMGRFRGGSAKIAITASSLFGSVSGVAVSNIVATGVVTIPLMIRAGFAPRFAASVEAVASTGGQLMPPVMGAVAFLMADFLERPYADIVVAALVPAILYYVALFIQADLEAARNGISRVPEAEIPRVAPVMKSGWVFVLPFAVLVGALFWLNWRAEEAALLASGVVLVIGLGPGYRGHRMSLGDVYRSLVVTGQSILDIFMIVAGAGMIIGILGVTGLGFAFTVMIVEFGGGNVVVLLLVTAVLCVILGMGMPTGAVYILLAILIAPSLIEVGIEPLAAHMFIFYLGMMSLITPPVAVAAFFAASIAKAPPMATGWTCMRFGWPAYVVPFLFVFAPSLLLQGDTTALLIDVPTAVVGVWFVSAAMMGYFSRRLDGVGRAVFLTVGVMLLLPHAVAPWVIWANGAGVVLAVALFYWEFSTARRKRHAAASEGVAGE